MAKLHELEVPSEQWETQLVKFAIAMRILGFNGLSREEPGRRRIATQAVAAQRTPRRRSRSPAAGINTNSRERGD